MGKKKGKSSTSSSGGSSSYAGGGGSGAARVGSGYKTVPQFWDELKCSPNRLDEILFIRASDLRDRIYDAGNEDEIELMRTGFINLQLETGKVGWIDGMLPEGVAPVVETSELEALSDYAALPKPPTEDEDGVPIKKSRAELDEEMRKKDSNPYNYQSIAASTAPNRANDDVMFLTKTEGMFDEDYEDIESRYVSGVAVKKMAESERKGKLVINVAVLQNGVFSMIRNNILDDVIGRISDPESPPHQEYANLHISVKFVNMLTFPKPVKHFKCLLKKGLRLNYLRSVMAVQCGLDSVEDIVFYIKGRCVANENDSSLEELGLKNGNKIIISKQPVPKESPAAAVGAVSTGKKMSNNNLQFVGDLLFSMGAMGRSDGDQPGQGAGGWVEQMHVSDAFQILGLYLENILMDRFCKAYEKDQAARKAEDDLLALLDEEDESKASVSKKKKGKKDKAAAPVPVPAPAPASAPASVSDEDAVVDSSSIGKKEEGENGDNDDDAGNDKDEDEDEDEDDDPLTAKAMAVINDEKAKAQKAEDEEKRQQDARKQAAAKKARAQAEKVSQEAARAHQEYMERLRREEEAKKKAEEEAMAKALALSRQQERLRREKEDEERRVAAKARKREKEKLSRKEKNALRKVQASESAATRSLGGGVLGSPSSLGGKLGAGDYDVGPGTMRPPRSRGPPVDGPSSSAPVSAAGAMSILSNISSFDGHPQGGGNAVGVLGSLLGHASLGSAAGAVPSSPPSTGSNTGSSAATAVDSPPMGGLSGMAGPPPGMSAPSGAAAPSPAVAPKFCTNCGSKLSLGNKFCGNCGTPIMSAASPPAAAAAAAAPAPAPPSVPAAAPSQVQVSGSVLFPGLGGGGGGGPPGGGWGGADSEESAAGSVSVLDDFSSGPTGLGGYADVPVVNNGPPAAPPQPSRLETAGLGGLLGGLGAAVADSGKKGGDEDDEGWNPLGA